MISTLDAAIEESSWSPELPDRTDQIEELRAVDEALAQRIATLRELERSLASHQVKLTQAEQVLNGLIHRIHGKLDDLIATQARGERTAERIEAAVSLASQQIDWIEQAAAGMDALLSERVEGLDAVAQAAFDEQKQRFRRCVQQLAGRTRAALTRDVQGLTHAQLEQVQADAQRIKDELLAAFAQVDDGSLDRLAQLRHDVDRLTETLTPKPRKPRPRKLKP